MRERRLTEMPSWGQGAFRSHMASSGRRRTTWFAGCGALVLGRTDRVAVVLPDGIETAMARAATP